MVNLSRTVKCLAPNYFKRSSVAATGRRDGSRTRPRINNIVKTATSVRRIRIISLSALLAKSMFK